MIALSQKVGALKKILRLAASRRVLRDVVLHAIAFSFISLMQKAFKVWGFHKKRKSLVCSPDKNKPTCEEERRVHSG